MNRVALFLLFVSTLVHAQGPLNPCAAYNATVGPFPYGNLDTYDHKPGGAHNFGNFVQGSCTYQGKTVCNTAATATSGSSATDTGALTKLFVVHEVAHSDAQGQSVGIQAGAIADAEGVGGATECASPGCAFGFTISGSGTGGGFSVTATGHTPIWSDKKHFTVSCPKQIYDGSCTIAPLSGGGDTPPPPNNPCGPSPVFIYTRHAQMRKPHGFSDPQHSCKLFDIKGDDNPLCVSWPTESSGVGWLVLPDNGEVTSIKQMFGDHTQHADADYLGVHNKDANGFLALQFYDQPAQGGNMDGVLDAKDKIWSSLRIWVDQHCKDNEVCKALPNELHSLEEFGISSISLTYEIGRLKDKNGNEFKFYTRVNPDMQVDQQTGHRHIEHQKSHDDRYAYDVYLAVKK